MKRFLLTLIAVSALFAGAAYLGYLLYVYEWILSNVML